VNLNTSVANCGACNTPAAPFANAAVTCVDGVRALGTCNPGYVWTVATGLFVLVAAVYPQIWFRPVVNASGGEDQEIQVCFLCRFRNCDGDASNGCEVDLNTSPANCGACNTPAAPFPNAAAACVNGVRALGTCNPGWVGRVLGCRPDQKATSQITTTTTLQAATATSATCQTCVLYLVLYLSFSVHCSASGCEADSTAWCPQLPPLHHRMPRLLQP
jgi:hypothetical protein